MYELDLPLDLQVVQGPKGPRFRGSAQDILILSEQIRRLSNAPLASHWNAKGLEFVVAETPTSSTYPNRIW